MMFLADYRVLMPSAGKHLNTFYDLKRDNHNELTLSEADAMRFSKVGKDYYLAWVIRCAGRAHIWPSKLMAFLEGRVACPHTWAQRRTYQGGSVRA
jgi:hypothetical protein